MALIDVPAASVQMVLLLRLSPLVPFGLLNYMLGLTGIPALSFVLCSWIGMLPGARPALLCSASTTISTAWLMGSRCRMHCCRHNCVRVPRVHWPGSSERPQPD